MKDDSKAGASEAAGAVYRGYSQAALDAQYDNRAKVPAWAEYLTRYRAASAQAREQHTQARLNVAVGPSAIEAIDIFPAAGPAPAPVLVFIHGGYWHMLDKADFNFVANGFVPHGITTVVINYGLIPTVTMAELVRQCRQAVAWTIANAASFGGDPARVAVSGHSAGGHLTAMIGATDWSTFTAPMLPVPVTHRPVAGYALSGLHDLEPIRACYLQQNLSLTADDVARFSPVRLPSPASGAWFALVGGVEGPEYERQSRDLAEAWRHAPAGVTVAAEVLPGHEHFSIVMALNDPQDPLTRRIAGDLLAR